MKIVTRMQDQMSGCGSNPVIQLHDAGESTLVAERQVKVRIEGKMKCTKNKLLLWRNAKTGNR